MQAIEVSRETILYREASHNGTVVARHIEVMERRPPSGWRRFSLVKHSGDMTSNISGSYCAAFGCCHNILVDVKYMSI